MNNVNVSGPIQPTSTYKTKVLKGNHSFASQVTEPNMKYVIKHDFVLDGDVTIPENCILEFDGGSISAGSSQNMDTITGANTGINASLVKIINTDITLAGTWNVVEAYPEWFGAKGDNSTDDTVALSKTINSFNRVALINTYLISDTLTIQTYGKSIYSDGKACIHQTANKIVFDITYEGTYLHNFSIHCDHNNYTSTAIKITRVEKINVVPRTLISHINVYKNWGINYDSVGILLESDNVISNQIGVYDVTIENCTFRYFAIGCYLKAIDAGTVHSNVVTKTFFVGCNTALKMETNGTNAAIINNIITDCNFQNNTGVTYDTPQNAIDCYGKYITDNDIDIFLWDTKPIPGTLGSCMGNIGKNNYKTHPSYYNWSSGKYLFLGCTPVGDTLYGDSIFGIKVITDMCVFEIVVHHKSNNFYFKKCQYTPSDSLLSVSFSPKLYYKILNNVVYYYLHPGTGNNFYVELINGTNAILSNSLAIDSNNELTELFSLARTIGSTSNRIDPPRYTLDGFMYYDRTLHKPYYRDSGMASGVAKWYDASGNEIQ